MASAMSAQAAQLIGGAPRGSALAAEAARMRELREALGEAHCEFTAVRSCSWVDKRSQPVTRRPRDCDDSVAPTGGFCANNQMNCCVNPSAFTQLLQLYGGDTVLDLGAGQGTYELYSELTRPAASGGPRWRSVDGTEGIGPATSGRVTFGDLVVPADVQGLAPADWVQCIEVAEHVPAAQQAALIANAHFLNRKGIVLSWAVPGQPGAHHVNRRTNEYVDASPRAHARQAGRPCGHPGLGVVPRRRG